MEKEPIMTPNYKGEGEPESLSTISEHPSYLGLAIGILIVLLTLVLIGLFIWGQMMTKPLATTPPTPQRPTAAENNEPESSTAEARAQILNVVSTSDELSAIEADLSATTIDDIEADLGSIDSELNAQSR